MKTPGPPSCKDNYEKLEFLGEGSFGVVKKYRCKKSNDFVAIKKIRLKAAAAGINISAIRELKTLQAVIHPHVIGLRDVFAHNQNINLVLDFMSTELEKIIKDPWLTLTPADIKEMMRQIGEGVAHIHSRWILHRDLKPGNILMDEKKSLKISDFGLACSFGSPSRAMSHQAVTRWYRPPELLFGAKNYGGGVDIWSLGCIFAELMLRAPFLPGETDINQLNNIFSALGTPTEDDWPEMKYLPDYFVVHAKPPPPLKKTFVAAQDDMLELLSRMMKFDPMARVTAVEMLQDPFFTNEPAPTPQENLPVPVPRPEGKSTHSSERWPVVGGMGPPRAMCLESPIQPLLFPTPDGGRDLNSSFEGTCESKVTKFTPASVDTCGVPRGQFVNRYVPDSEERGKIRKRKLDMDRALEDAANEC